MIKGDVVPLVNIEASLAVLDLVVFLAVLVEVGHLRLGTVVGRSGFSGRVVNADVVVNNQV